MKKKWFALTVLLISMFIFNTSIVSALPPGNCPCGYYSGQILAQYQVNAVDYGYSLFSLTYIGNCQLRWQWADITTGNIIQQYVTSGGCDCGIWHQPCPTVVWPIGPLTALPFSNISRPGEIVVAAPNDLQMAQVIDAKTGKVVYSVDKLIPANERINIPVDSLLSGGNYFVAGFVDKNITTALSFKMMDKEIVELPLTDKFQPSSDELVFITFTGDKTIQVLTQRKDKSIAVAEGKTEIILGERITTSCLKGIDFNASENFVTTLYDINPLTGAASNPRSTGIPGAIGLVWGADGFLYTVTAGNQTESALYQIDPVTGNAQMIGHLGIGYVYEGDLAVNPTTGVLYGIDGMKLFTVSFTTGAATIIANYNYTSVDYSYLGFDDAGTLYAIDDTITPGQLSTRLVTLDPSTGQVLTTRILTPALGGDGGMDFNPATGLFYVVDGKELGSPYAGANALYTLNPATGALNLVGPTGNTQGGFSGLVQCRCQPSDVWIPDTQYDDVNPATADIGNEPDVQMAGLPMWKSGSIWVRRQADGGTTHQNPLYGTPNTIYAKVRNDGLNPIKHTGKVRFFWAKASTGLAWNTSNWTEIIGSNNPVTLQPNTITTVASPPWIPSGSVGDGHFCLVAIWWDDDPQYQIPSVIYSTNDINYLTYQSNNVAWRNVNVVALSLGGKEQVKVIFRNIEKDTGLLNLAIRPSKDQLKNPFLVKQGNVYIELEPKVFEGWQANGGQGSGFKMIGPNLMQIVEPTGAVLSNIPMETGQESIATLTFEAFPDAQLGIYNMEAVQSINLKDSTEVEQGGVAYEITLVENDDTIPLVDTFKATSPSTSLHIPITTFTASDNVGVTGYLITESASQPAPNAIGWTTVAPTSYTVTSDGTYTLYPWAKDAAGNVSAIFGSPASVSVKTATVTVTPTKTPTPTRTPSTITLLSIAAQDGWVLESSETSNAGGSINSSATTFYLGDDATRKQYRGILSFNTGPSLPDNAVITGVTLKVRQQAILGGGNPVTMFQGFMFDIKKGFFGTTSALQTGDFQAAASAAYGPSAPAPVGGWYSFNLTSAKAYVNKLATGSGLTQIRLRFKLDDNNNAIANYLSLFSGNAPAANQPQLVITYIVP
jgi:hypothetical protein